MSISASKNEARIAHAVKLSQEQVAMIEEALDSVGEFGEVRLVVEKSRLRFLVVQKSVDALKWERSNANGNR